MKKLNHVTIVELTYVSYLVLSSRRVGIAAITALKFYSSNSFEDAFFG